MEFSSIDQIGVIRPSLRLKKEAALAIKQPHFI
jgi:hypothetical protein